MKRITTIEIDEVIRRARAKAKIASEKATQNVKRVREQTQTRAKIAREKTRARVQKVREDTTQAVRVAKEQTKKTAKEAVRLFRINLANTLTLFNGVCGFLSILVSISGNFILAATLMLCGVIFDWLDGKAARYFGEETSLGKELDSLSDNISFGIAPAILVAMIYPSFESIAIGALFVISANVRLGRFNIQQTTGEYSGLPTTMGGLVIIASTFLQVPHVIMPWILLLLALLMNAPIRIKKMF